MKTFLKKKNIIISLQKYGIDAMSAMAFGLMASLVVGLIIKTWGQQSIILWGDNSLSQQFIVIGTTAMSMTGAAIGAAIAFRLQAPNLVLFSSVVAGILGYTSGGPAGAYVAAVIAVEAGKIVSKETPLDILITPMTVILVGALIAATVSPAIAKVMGIFGTIIVTATTYQPILMGAIIAVVMSFVLVSPLTSAGLAIMLNLTGLAAGAATVGCACAMMGFATIGYKDNKISSFVGVGLGTAKLQMANVIKNGWILIPPTFAALIAGPISTTIFKMSNIAVGAGMGTSGLVGQITTLNEMGYTTPVLISILIMHFILPSVLSLIPYYFLLKAGKIKDGDLKLDV
ncbi:MAG: phosphotransferase system EIIC [Erysipelotrichaceae bacterium]|nr:MAG: phosphotransferase system [Erysipelotrichaceae bacterium]TXT18389.1 MAG: phosphotransferase system EIIC [Erysipelotrichaceae bacterium]